MEENQIKEPDATYDKHYTYADYLKFNFDEMEEIIKDKILKLDPLLLLITRNYPELLMYKLTLFQAR